MRNYRQWDCTGFNGDGSDRSKIPHGEPHAGKQHVAPSLCYGVTDRFDEGQPPKNDEVRFEDSQRPSGRTRRGASRSTLHPMKVSDMEQKWYNMRHGHERRNAHVEAERRQDEVFGCIPHGRGALI